MKWFRANIRHGSRLALLALAIQFALSFGHFHAVAAEATGANRAQRTNLPSNAARADDVVVVKQIVQSAQTKSQQPAPNHDSGGQSDDACAICAVMAMASAVMFTTPPLLQLPQAVEFLYRTTEAEFVHLNALRVAFQPRAPPIS